MVLTLGAILKHVMREPVWWYAWLRSDCTSVPPEVSVGPVRSEEPTVAPSILKSSTRLIQRFGSGASPKTVCLMTLLVCNKGHLSQTSETKKSASWKQSLKSFEINKDLPQMAYFSLWSDQSLSSFSEVFHTQQEGQFKIWITKAMM